MPAVTADTLSLPRITTLPWKETDWRPVASVVTAHSQLEGEGFVVRRPFPSQDLSLADPFLLLDHLGAVEYAPGEAKGTPWHPHRGFETVTYIMDGAFEHQDTTGGGGLIADGATQWMTAGAGIQHIERPPDTLVTNGGLFHGVQLWV
ncbi:MAG: pirin family protein, partial [Chloroflexi bacterium]|nr:pirin family protein [Chloroflexota bacterium]